MNSLVFQPETKAQLLRQNTQTQIRRRRGQSDDCSPPSSSGDCGYGLWNEGSCECNCIPVSAYVLYVKCYASAGVLSSHTL